MSKYPNIRILPLDFQLAKIIYQEHHRTTNIPIGHKQSYVLIQDTFDEFGNRKYEKICDTTCFDDVFENYMNKNYPDGSWDEDILWMADEGGDPHLWSLGKIIGICSIGNPVARFTEKNVYEINRICFLRYSELKTNFEKKLPSKLVREAVKDFKNLYKTNKIYTYIHKWENGKYLEYAGFRKDKVIKYSQNCKGWNNRPNRKKSNLENKIRFVADDKIQTSTRKSTINNSESIKT